MTKRLLENWGYKLFALGISVVIWIGLADEPELGTSVAAPIQYRNMPQDLEMSSDVRDQVRLEVRGPSSKLTAVDLAQTVILLDLAGVNKPGDRTFPVTAGNTTLPAGVRLDRAVPSQVRLHFERRMAKEVPVMVRIGEGPAAGFELARQSVEPSVLKIVGPESRVREVLDVETDPVDLSEVQGQAEFRVHAYLADPQVRFDGPANVRVSIAVRKTAQNERE